MIGCAGVKFSAVTLDTDVIKNTTFTTPAPNNITNTGNLPRTYPTVISTAFRRMPRPAQQAVLTSA